MIRRAYALFFAGLLLLACGDETTINNYDLTSSGVIHGSITPIEISTLVRLDSIWVVVIREDGDFTFTNVEPGEHVITIEPPTYSARRITNIEVWPSQVHLLGKIELTTLPYPVYRIYPSDGDSNISSYKTGGIQLFADESLDTADLGAKTTIIPSVPGHWQGKSDSLRQRSSYVFLPDPEPLPPGAVRPPNYTRIFRIGTTYNVRIDGSVRTTFGVPLGRDIEFTFKTEPLSMFVSISNSGLEGGVRMSAFSPRLIFNDTIDIDSIAKAVTFDPPIEGIWRLATDRDECTFLPSEGPLLPSTTYTMIVSNEVAVSGQARLRLADTSTFTTEPVGVLSYSPCDGCTGTNFMRFEFNTPMDRASVVTAFRLTNVNGDTLSGTLGWDDYSRPDRSMYFRSTIPLSSGALYKMTLSTEAKSAGGVPIYREHVSYFLAY